MSFNPFKVNKTCTVCTTACITYKKQAATFEKINALHNCTDTNEKLADICQSLPDLNERLFYSVVQFVIKSDKHTCKKHENQI